MPRSSSPPRGRQVVQAELIIQYKSVRASSIIRTPKEDRPAREKLELRKITDDLKDLKLVENGFYPSRYDIQWKHGAVGAGWRLVGGSVSPPRARDAFKPVANPQPRAG